MHMKSFIPNGLTLLNLLMGCLAIHFVMTGFPMAVLYCLLVSAVADFFDGWAARVLDQAGNLGKELDSLADVVSFGAVPGFMMFSTLQAGLSELSIQSSWIVPVSLLGFVITLSSAYRLARFNIDTRQVEGFIGLATPGNTIFFLGLYLGIHLDTFGIGHILFNPFLLIGTIAVFSYLLNSNIHMFKLKIGKWKGHERQYILMVLLVPLLLIMGPLGLSVIIILYILLSLLPFAETTKR